MHSKNPDNHTKLRQYILLTNAESKVYVYIALIIGIYITVSYTVGHFEQTDEIFFKSAGINWVQTGKFAAPDMAGLFGFAPPVEDVFFAYPPLYSAMFGLYTEISGFGHTENMLFDILIHALLLCLIFVLCLNILKQQHGYLYNRISIIWAIMPTIICTPLAQYGRPDELAMSLGLLAVISILRIPKSYTRSLFAGIFMGLCLSTSISVALAYGMVISLLLLRDRNRWGSTVLDYVFIGLSGALVFISILIFIYGDQITAISQLLEVLFEHQTGIPLVSGLMSAIRYNSHRLVLYASILVISILVLVLKGSKDNNKWLYYWGGVWLFLFFCLSRVPHKGHYLWFLTPYGLSLAVASISELKMIQKHSMYFVQTLLLALSSLIALALPTRSFVINLMLPENQRTSFVESELNRVIPKNSNIALGGLHWAMLRNQNKVLSIMWSGTKSLKNTDYVILSANGSGQIETPNMKFSVSKVFLASEFELVHNSLPKSAPSLFGLPISRSSWGYGFMLLKRKTNEDFSQP